MLVLALMMFAPPGRSDFSARVVGGCWMPIRFACPACGSRFKVQYGLAGRRTKCATCGAQIVVPLNDEGDEPADSPPVVPNAPAPALTPATTSPPPPPPQTTAVPSAPVKKGPMLVSSGDIGRPYEVISLVTGYATSDEKFLGSISGGAAYEAAIKRLQEAAGKLGADALIYVNLHGNMGIKRAFVGEVHMYEVFAWGTAVRFSA